VFYLLVISWWCPVGLQPLAPLENSVGLYSHINSDHRTGYGAIPSMGLQSHNGHHSSKQGICPLQRIDRIDAFLYGCRKLAMGSSTHDERSIPGDLCMIVPTVPTGGMVFPVRRNVPVPYTKGAATTRRKTCSGLSACLTSTELFLDLVFL